MRGVKFNEGAVPPQLHFVARVVSPKTFLRSLAVFPWGKLDSRVTNLLNIILLSLLLLLPLAKAADEPVPNLFRVRHIVDVAGQDHLLGGKPGTKVVVIVFLGPECPISQRYVPELNRLAAGRGTNGLEFYGVVSGRSAKREEAAAFQKDYAIQFPILFDEGGLLARWFHPTHVPEAFVLKPDGDIVYHGRIDDGYASPGRPRAVVQHRELRDAIAAVRAGRTPGRVYAPPVGCYFE